jgi:ATP-dependent DNA helicase RecQ
MTATQQTSDEAVAILKSTFGFDAFRPGQTEVIQHLLDGQSAAAVFPTGAGKSLCYQLPALMLPGLTLVVSPLIALMKDQIDQLHARGIAASRLDSSLTADEARDVYAAVEGRDLRLLYVAPERFNNERFRELIQRTPVSLFAVDEAHCISEWGHNFRPDYLKLAGFAHACGAERILALTATATPKVLDDICQGFDIDPACATRTGFYRPNLTLEIQPVSGGVQPLFSGAGGRAPAQSDRDDVLLDRIKSRPPGPTIVYVTLQRTAEQVAGRLAAAGYAARPYHAGLADDERTAVQDWFIASKDAIVVATIAFGMGIDKANIRYVDHYNLPKSIENYSQEIGRAGRDDLPATCSLLACPDDLNTLENFVYGDTPSLSSIKSLLDTLFVPEPDPILDLNLYELSSQHDIRPLVLRTLLTYLELDGYLEEGTPFYSSYQFKPLTSSAEILSHFETERRDFIASVLRHSRPAKVWFHIDLDQVAQATQEPRDRFVRALDYLAQQGWIELKAEGVRNRFRLLQTPSDLAATADALYSRTQAREEREVARLQEVVDLAQHHGCLVAKLSAHFGEILPAPCGHCSWCATGHSVVLPERHALTPDPTVLEQLPNLVNEHPELFAEPRAIARFLCGLSSPRLTKARLSAHPLYGSLSEVPFPAVLAEVSHLSSVGRSPSLAGHGAEPHLD